jgi:hypothetical protein
VKPRTSGRKCSIRAAQIKPKPKRGVTSATSVAVVKPARTKIDRRLAMRRIPVIGRRLNIPVISKSHADAADHFGWFAHFAGLDCPASSAQTRGHLGWRPTQRALIPDMNRPSYFEAKQKTV